MKIIVLYTEKDDLNTMVVPNGQLTIKKQERLRAEKNNTDINTTNLEILG